MSSTPPPPMTPRAPRRDRVAAPGGRGAGFGAGELQSFLETLEEHLPLGRDERELVFSIHNRSFSANNRTVDSLRRKFAALCRSRIPTGNPTCPAESLSEQLNLVFFDLSSRASTGSGDEDIMELMRMQLRQSQVDERTQREERRLRQEEERLPWEGERRQRDQDRLDERLRREEADHRHEQLMQMMMTVVGAAFKPHE
ncbi:hypothetical protein F442_04618 [Phytophthora nicotianae P10297]|uniref:DUF6818 domain-containing protein n=1 Tax=Phytophthora nicotianae P10297 TaxID=1317064 RepID=W2ZSG8_PHYNI|nr:hypothetical protein F442_04618 [Phytophthora nicotianae P10297]